MKHSSISHTALLATLLLAGVSVAAAADCGAGNSGNIDSTATATFVCTCPAGTGVITPNTAGTSLAGVANFVVNAGSTFKWTSTNAASVTGTLAVSTITLTATGTGGANTATLAALAGLCDDMMPGYMTTTVSSTTTITSVVVICGVGQYCPGLVGLFSGVLPSAIVAGDITTGTIANLVLASNTAFTTTLVVGASAQPKVAPACPTGSTNAGGSGMISIAFCSALLPGYYIPTGAAAGNAPSLCPAGSYCSGSASPAPALAGIITVAATANFGLTACPAGTTSGGAVASGATGLQVTVATYLASWAGAAGTSSSPLGVCSGLAAGYFLPLVPTTGTAAACTLSIGTFGTGGTANLCSIPTACPVGFYCPASTSSVLLLAVNAISDLSSTNVWQGVSSTSATYVVLVSNAQVTVATSAACTTGYGLGGISAISAATGCNSVAAGYYLQPGSTLPVACAAAVGSYCPGFSTATGVTLATNAVSANTAATASGVVACPIYATGTATGQSSAATACTGLVAGYALAPGVTSTKLASLFYTCPTGATCPAVPLFFGGAIDPVNTNGAGRDEDYNYYGVQCLVLGAYGATNQRCATAMDILNTTDLTAAVTTLTTTGTQLGLVNTGYFIAPNGYTPAVCPTGSVCAGGDYLGDAIGNVVGVPVPCPAGTTLSVSGTLGATTGCILNSNFYASTANTASLCPANSYCPGGGLLGIAGGAFPCTANSTIDACNTYLDNIQSHSYSAGSTTIAAAAAPAVTVTTPAAAAPAVTVSPAPITVTPAPITVTTAPVTVTPAPQPITVNVPAPVSAASTRSSALVLVLAALAALAAF